VDSSISDCASVRLQHLPRPVIHLPLEIAADTIPLEGVLMRRPAFVFAVILAFGLTGCTLIQKAVTGAAAGGAAGWFIAGPPGAAVGAGAGAVVLPIVGP
jgi:hypothetical protein